MEEQEFLKVLVQKTLRVLPGTRETEDSPAPAGYLLWGLLPPCIFKKAVLGTQMLHYNRQTSVETSLFSPTPLCFHGQIVKPY